MMEMVQLGRVIALSSIQRKLFPLLVTTTHNSNMKTLELDP